MPSSYARSLRGGVCESRRARRSPPGRGRPRRPAGVGCACSCGWGRGRREGGGQMVRDSGGVGLSSLDKGRTRDSENLWDPPQVTRLRDGSTQGPSPGLCTDVFSMATGRVRDPHFLPHTIHGSLGPWLPWGILPSELALRVHCDPVPAALWGVPLAPALLAPRKGPAAGSVRPSGQPPTETVFPGARGAERPGSSPRSGSSGVTEG